jgi:Tetratricopeptide repeat
MEDASHRSSRARTPASRIAFLAASASASARNLAPLTPLARSRRGRLRQEVSCAHAHLDGAERVLGGLPPRAHSVRIFVEPLLHRLEYVLVLRTRDAALWAWRTAAFERAIPAGIGPIAVQLKPVFLARKIRDMARGVAQVTLVQGTSSSASSERLLMADQFYRGQRTARVQVDPVMRNLARVYGTLDGGLAQLDPDLIGEHHVATISDVELVEGCLHWLKDESVETQKKRRRDLLTVLQRATQPEPGITASNRAARLLDYLIRIRLDSLAGEMVAVTIDTPGDLVRRLDQSVETLDDKAWAAIDDALPLQSLTLMEFSLRAAVRRARLARELVATAGRATEDVAPHQQQEILGYLAERLRRLGNRLSDLGRREEALAASQEAVDIDRRFAETRPDAFLPYLATSLNSLGSNLSDLGRREEALAASQEAVDIYRRLAETRSDAFLPDLARSLGVLG